ncbi:hypothetical protein LWC34_23970 [Kibdelosporangium philippinense]|uniref:MYXO-CTERM domain-containing protein n=1 Tax=Kibdelosporangium philippinense TaxID=211113 RepID=A0ABS8ZJ60_9PSEU|nr:hypothetical protein [Kibdelosporangium philippinense]MCE7005862.1 hypothetical protein [Kibdelosporangium philippinense]
MMRAVAACVLVVLFSLPVGAATAAPADLAPYAQQTATAPAGPSIAPQPTEEEQASQRQRLVIGIAAALLLGIVILGHRARRKRAKKNAG